VTRAASPRRLVFLGTPEVAVLPLQALVAAGFELALVITRVDKRRGRGSQLLPSPVKAAAIELGIPVSHSVDDGLGVGADLGVVVAFGQLIKPHVLEKLPMVNLHFSLLPRWRGAAPVERALLAGDSETGVCLMQLEEGLDTGPVYRREVVPIHTSTTATELRQELVRVGTELLLDELRAGLGAPQPQVGEPTYAAKITAEELRIDWSKSPAQIDRLVRVGGAWTTLHGRRLRIGAVDMIDADAPPSNQLRGDRVGGLHLLTVQPEGKAAMPFDAFARGARLAEVECLGAAAYPDDDVSVGD
jgi:methionyl-tRNA formyltransferase